MAFFAILLFIALVVNIICLGVLIWERLYHGKKSMYTPIAFITLGIITLLMGAMGADVIFFGIVSLVMGIVWYIKYKSDERSGVHEMERDQEQQQIEIERQNAITSQQSSEPWAIRYMTSPCPYCGHYKVRYAKWEDKRMSVAFWGAASDKIGKNYKCAHCQRMWE